MRIIFGLLALIVFSMASASQEDSWMKACKVASDIAEEIMSARQDGVKMSDLMSAVKDDDTFGELGEKLVVRAYEKHAYISEQRKHEAVIRFGNEVYLECWKSLAN